MRMLNLSDVLDGIDLYDSGRAVLPAAFGLAAACQLYGSRNRRRCNVRKGLHNRTYKGCKYNVHRLNIYNK